MSELTLLHESTVDESEIDSLGHMNVRFYVERATIANNALISKLDIADQVGKGEQLRRVDTYNRFHREQFAGARLKTLGGLIPTESSNGLTGYYEIRNADNNDLAATFILTSHRIDAESEELLSLAPPAPDPAESLAISMPDYGRPRSLSLTPTRIVTWEELDPIIPRESVIGNFSGRHEGLVLDEDCDSTGRLREETDPMFVMFRPQPGEAIQEMGPPVTHDAEGRRYSWAMIEIRSVNWHRPAAGDTIVSMSADLDFGEKWRHSRRWMFAKESKQLLGISDNASLCMDLDARRAIPIPTEVREAMEARSLPEFA